MALVRKSADLSNLPNHENLSIATVDYKQELSVQFQQKLDEFGKLDLFIHNAGVTVSLNKQEYFDINTVLTQNILAALKTSTWLNEGKFIYMSSLAAEGPMGFDSPISLYGESKLAAESKVKESAFRYLIIRPTAIYGAGDFAFLPLFKAAAKGIYPLTNRHQKMSMIHAKDLAEIILHESMKTEGILHATDGQTYLHQHFIDALEMATSKRIRKIPVPASLSKLSLGLSDVWHKLIGKRPRLTNEKFQEISQDWDLHSRNELCFSHIPCKITLEEGFRDAYNYYKTQNLL